MEQWGQASLGDTGGKEAAEILAAPILLILLGDLANYFFAKKKGSLSLKSSINTQNTYHKSSCTETQAK